MKLICALIAGASIAAAPFAAAAQEPETAPASPEFRLDATARVLAFHATHDPAAPSGSLVFTGELMTQVKFTSETQARIEVRASSPGSDGRRVDGIDGVEGRVLEAYVAHHFTHADLRVGKQIVAWGRADGVNPTDNLTPRDFVTWLPFEDDQRFGVWAARFDVHLRRSLDAGLYFSPLFEPAVIPKPILRSRVTEPTLARNLANSQFAFKLNQSTHSLDWSVSYYRGPHLLGTARLLGVTALGPELEFHHDRVQAVGADLARSVGHFGLRAEGAWTWPSVTDDGGPAFRRPDFYAVVGLDRTVREHLYINGQVFGRQVQGFVDPYANTDPALRYVAVQNAITVGQQDRISVGYTVRVTHKWLVDTLEAELVLVDEITRDDRFVRPVFSYAVTDHVKVMFGGVIYRGAIDTTFGRKTLNNRAFLELRYAR